MNVISYGGGVQSTAMVVLAARGELPHGPYDAALFSNVGDDSEHPATLEYVHNIAIPWADKEGFPIHVLQRVMRTGETRTLWQDLMRDSKTINIPIRMANGAPGNRNCTATYKMKVVGKWLKEHGASADSPATVAIGISTDEIIRVKNKKSMPHENPVYPLIDLGLDRSRCMAVIREAGLPIPPKSSCFFCPFHRPQQWAEMRRDEPELFERAAQLEEVLNERRHQLGKDDVYLTRFAQPLREAIASADEMLPLFAPDTDSCDEGYCWT